MPTAKTKIRRYLVHSYRIGLFVLLIFMIHQQHRWFMAQKQGAMKQLVSVEKVAAFFPQASSLGDWDPGHRGQNVFDAKGNKLGHVIQTSPEADNIYGFSGPSNTMIAFSKELKILGISVIRSDDTREHLAALLKDELFLTQWNALNAMEAAAMHEVYAVSGATLTSSSIADGIARRLGGRAKKSRFPEAITLEEIQPFLEGAAALESSSGQPYLKRILDATGTLIGYACRTSPHADHMIGYQGPTDVLFILDAKERVSELVIRSSYDNEPFVSYLIEDEYFFNNFKGFRLDEISQIEIGEEEIYAISSATKTSITVAEGLVESATEIIKVHEELAPQALLNLRMRDYGTIVMVLFALVIAHSRLRGKRWLRTAFQLTLVIYLGFINADMVSQAQLVGWAKSGIPWQVAPGLIFLTAAAFITPVFSGRQVYCTHLCPFGACQDLVAGRLPYQFSIKGKWEKILVCIPVFLLAWSLIVALGHLPFSLIAIEPFDAFVFRIAAWTTLTLAITGLIASLFVKRAYCRYACPSGALLKYLRFGGTASERFGLRDVIATAFVLLAMAMLVWR